jgi:DNA relaxase NicK
VFCRVYDKEAESGEEFYANCTRYEVEFHNNAANDAALYLFSGSRAQARASASTCWQVFNERGIKLPYDRESEENALLPQRAAATDIDRKINWLREQVRPTVRKLALVLDRGIIEQALWGDTDEPISEAESHLTEEMEQWEGQ